MILKLKKKIIFRILKSYKLFLKSDKKHNIHQIINEMMKKRIFIDKKNILDTYFFGELIDESDLIIKQYFFQTFIHENKIFSKFLLYFSEFEKWSFFILPSFALKIIKNKIDINFLTSQLLFKLYEIYKISKGIYFFIKVLIKSFIKIVFYKQKKNFHSSVYFADLVEKFLPSKKNGYDMVSSVLRNDNKKLDKVKVYSNCIKKSNINDVEYFDLFIIYDFKSLIKFFIKFVILLFVSFISLINGKWYISILFEEKLKKILIENMQIDKLPNKIYFNLTSFMYRPIWTYFKYEKKFDTAMIIFSDPYYNENTDDYFKLMSWPEYFVQSINTKKKLQNLLNYQFNSIICDYIGFNDTINEFNKKIDIIIFDDEPFREWHSVNLLRSEDHWNEKACLRYLNDLGDVFRGKNFNIAIKLKKKNLKKISKKYLNIFKKNNLNFLFIDPKFSAIEIIKKTSVVIAFPFSTTAHYGIKLSKNTIYYYPFKLKNKPWVDEGIKVIEEKHKLLEWVQKIEINK